VTEPGFGSLATMQSIRALICGPPSCSHGRCRRKKYRRRRAMGQPSGAGRDSHLACLQGDGWSTWYMQRVSSNSTIVRPKLEPSSICLPNNQAATP